MSKRKPHLYLQDILDSIEKIGQYTEGISYEEFANNQEKIDAVIRNLEILGEAAKNIPQKVQNKHPDIPWEKMVSMRNKVLHEYFGVDEEILWKTISEDLPVLKNKLSEIPELVNQ